MNENVHFIVEQTIAITYVDHMLLCQLLDALKGFFIVCKK